MLAASRTSAIPPESLNDVKYAVGIRLQGYPFVRASQALRLDDVIKIQNLTVIGMVFNIAAQHPARDPREHAPTDTRICQYLLPDQQVTRIRECFVRIAETDVRRSGSRRTVRHRTKRTPVGYHDNVLLK